MTEDVLFATLGAFFVIVFGVPLSVALTFEYLKWRGGDD